MITVTVVGGKLKSEIAIKTTYRRGDVQDAVDYAMEKREWLIPTASGCVVIGKLTFDECIFIVEESDGE